MEFKKDNQKDKALSVIHYNPNFFKGESDLYVLYKKLENISAALFLVSQSLPDTEILKNELRVTSLQGLKSVLSLISQKVLRVDDLQETSVPLFQLASVLDVAVWSGLVSHMNATLLQNEIGNCVTLIERLYEKYKTNYFLDSSFFQTETLKTEDVQPKAPKVIKDIPKGQNIKDKFVFHSKSDRREKIMALLKTKPAITVKDAVFLMPEFSEKTLQRELLALVQEGVLTKQGDRRWSTYSIAR